jgi:phosphoserine phosphatase RsbU/P
MEVWGGNRSTWSNFVVPGLDIWVYSQPFEGDEQGGDVYYVSSCASGRITRMLVGDVSGHGSEASVLSTELRDIMRRNVNYIDQSRVVKSLNEQFEEAATVGRFATAIVGTYFAPTRSLTVCLAGHPSPLIFRAESQTWAPLVGGDSSDHSQSNMPFGILGEQKFASTKLKLKPGDLVLAYTDSLYEAFAANGEMLRAVGIAEIAKSISVDGPGDFVTTLLQRIRDLNPQNLASDDTTVVLARANSERVSLKDNVLAPFRLLRGLFS